MADILSLVCAATAGLMLDQHRWGYAATAGLLAVLGPRLMREDNHHHG